MFYFRQIWFVIVFFVLILVSLGLFLNYFVIPKSFIIDNQIVTVPENSTAGDIAHLLEETGIIKSSYAFKLYLKLFKLDKDCRSGTFMLGSHMSLGKIGHILSTQSGDYYYTKVTIPEGFSIVQIVDLLADKNIVEYDSFLSYVAHEAKDEFILDYEFLQAYSYDTLEGYLFPDTYYFKENDNYRDIVNVMLNEFYKQIVIPYEASILKSKYTLHELSVLSSMIEKESRRHSEMKTISSVFYNRLNKGMKLASDPTVVYSLGQSYKDRVYYKDLKVDSPYNTYKYKGLPPTPISSFGTLAFEASLYPIKSPYLFFVAVDNGYHHFSQTYAEHLSVQNK